VIRIAVLDDYQQVGQGLADWASLGADVRVDFLGPSAGRAGGAAAAALAGYDVDLPDPGAAAHAGGADRPAAAA
jgi:hypothetical protein